MSAFVVPKVHIDAIIAGWVLLADQYSPAAERLAKAAEIGAMLWRENHRSVNARYNENEKSPGYRYDRIPMPRKHRPETLAILAQALACYEYQSCECDDWEESAAAKFCNQVRHEICRALPGYDKAEAWNVRDRDVYVKPEAPAPGGGRIVCSNKGI